MSTTATRPAEKNGRFIGQRPRSELGTDGKLQSPGRKCRGRLAEERRRHRADVARDIRVIQHIERIEIQCAR